MDPFYLALLLYLAALVLALVDLFVPSGGVLAILAVLSATACVLFGFRSGQIMGMSMLTLVVASNGLLPVRCYRRDLRVPSFLCQQRRATSGEWDSLPVGRSTMSEESHSVIIVLNRNHFSPPHRRWPFFLNLV